MKFIIFCSTLYSLLLGIFCQSPNVSVANIIGTGYKQKDDNKTTTQLLSGSLPLNTVLICPGEDYRVPIFPLPCRVNEECFIMGPKMICCSNLCIKGIPSIENDKINSIDPIQSVSPKSEIRSGNEVLRPVEQKLELVPRIAISLPQNISLVCPGKEVRIPFLSFPCNINRDCSIMRNAKMLCCSNRCIEGVVPAKLEAEYIALNTISNTIPNTISSNAEVKLIANDNIVSSTITPTQNDSKLNLNVSQNLQQQIPRVCPGNDVRIPFFAYPCTTNKDCAYMKNDNIVCCSSRCVEGVVPPKPEIKHAPSWFGLVERNCPVDPITEILEVKECNSDADCAPRICCTDKHRNGTKATKSYCRTPQPSLERFPVADRLIDPLKIFAGYLQCTPPPPPLLDIFPKPCKNTLDCFPNLCCQEDGKKFCRPPKRSLLSFVAGVGQRFVPSDAARRLFERLN